MTEDQLDTARAAIMEIYGNTSLSIEDVIEELRTLVYELEDLITGLETQLEEEE